MNTENITEDAQVKMQFILDENKELKEIPKDQCKTVKFPIKYQLNNAFEVFVRVKDTENYWISNYGRCVSNFNRNGKNIFYKHKEGKCHYTIFEIQYYITSCPTRKHKSRKGKANKNRKKMEKVFDSNTSEQERNDILEEKQKSDNTRIYSIESDRYKRETTPENLVVDAFLVKYPRRFKVWHKDGDESNNWYKNLLLVTAKDYKKLKAGEVTWQELNLEQEYIEYENKAGYYAYREYYNIRARCKDTKNNDKIGRCYDNTTMWQGWLDDPRSFVKWYLEHYYKCGDETMHTDKDLFGDGSGMYHPNFCCILPQGLNTMLANAKKHYKEGKTPDNTLPLGVSYNSKTGKFVSSIQFTGEERPIQLSEWDTAEEAFEEYKKMKQADILIVAAKYKEHIPDYIYQKLLTVEVKPY